MNNAFIIGTGRCGTSWLGQMLNSHADICVPPEIQLLFEYSGNGNRLFEEFSLAGESEPDGELLASIIEQGCPHNLDLFFDYREFCLREDTPKNSAVNFLSAFYSAIAQSYGKKWLIEQTPWYGQRLDLVSRFFPKAKFVHMIRDGRDVALSFSRTPWWHVSPRINLARWQREIKKIALDAAFYLSADTYLEVKYESLVTNTEFEMRRICEFLGVNFDPVMLDPKNLIDYDQFCKFDMKTVSSQFYTDWRLRKDSTSFSENVGAWRRSEDLFHAPLPPQIASWLTHYEYEVEQVDGAETDIFQYHQEYSFNALERDLATRAETNARLLDANECQVAHISVIEDELARQTKHIHLVELDWAARGDLIEQHSDRLAAQANQNAQLHEELATQVKQNQLIEQDWVARGDLIGELSNTLETQVSHIGQLEQELVTQAEHIQSIERDWTARGELIGQLSGTLEAQVNHNAQLQQELVNQAEHIRHVEQDWTARGELIGQLSGTLEAQVNHNAQLQRELVNQIEHIRHVEQDWAARGDLIGELSNSLEKQVSHNAQLEQDWAKQAEQIHSLERDWEARGDLIGQLSATLEAQVNHNVQLQQQLVDQVEQIQLVERDWAARGDLITQLSNNLDVQTNQGILLEQELSMRSRHVQLVEQDLAACRNLVEQLSKNIEAQTIDNAVLKEEVENARSNIGKLEVELTGLRNSWCGKLKSLLNK
ncbi:sulfotransferase [Pseudomonas sp. fls2-241-R2A-110]|jgi:hypothetical protein|uniref:sulfotransferase n=1 Tax=unclassified Pseudomonas TaxID=196821 RepID=UPI002556FBFC|nr:sulfotransferase [Pseudomonas sp. fls2-241-R2A-110]